MSWFVEYGRYELKKNLELQRIVLKIGTAIPTETMQLITVTTCEFYLILMETTNRQAL
jgi:hypothetical protein